MTPSKSIDTLDESKYQSEVSTINPQTEALLKKIHSDFRPRDIESIFSNPVFIVSAPRSGSTLLFNLLSQNKDIWTIGGESHGIYNQFPHLEAENKSFDSGCLNAKHADKNTAKAMRALYLSTIMNRDKVPFIQQRGNLKKMKITFLEKTPRNSLNIPFIRALYPNARFIFLHRDPRENISSIIEAWQQGKKDGQFITFRQLPDWPLNYWCLILPPGWRQHARSSLAEIAAFQWNECNKIILDNLSTLPKRQWISLSYQELISNAEESVSTLCDFMSVEMDSVLQTIVSDKLPLSSTVVTQPSAEKWRRHETEILPCLPNLEHIIGRLNALNTV